MQRHELDVVSLLAGVVFVAIAGGYALTHTTDLRLHWLIAVPALLLLIGAAATAMAVRRILAAREHPEPIGDVTDPT
jgi:membrane protein implicated in regulation of membrane protease activity